jgi:hypothetical protein
MDDHLEGPVEQKSLGQEFAATQEWLTVPDTVTVQHIKP